MLWGLGWKLIFGALYLGCRKMKRAMFLPLQQQNGRKFAST